MTDSQFKEAFHLCFLFKKEEKKKNRRTTSLCHLPFPKCRQLPRLARHATWSPCNVSCLQRSACCAVKYSLLNCQRHWTPAQHTQHDGSAASSSLTCTTPPPQPPPPHIHTHLTNTIPTIISPMPALHLNTTFQTPDRLTRDPSLLHSLRFIKKKKPSAGAAQMPCWLAGLVGCRHL